MAMILDASVRRFVGKLSEFVEGEMSMMLGVKDELKKLQRRMERVRGILESAEQKRHTYPDINIWVRELKDVMYDADDIIDCCMIEGRRLLEDHPSESAVRRPLSLFSCFSCIKFRHEIGRKIRKLNERWKHTVEDISILSKLEPARQGDQASGANHRQTFSIEVKSDIVGTQIEEATHGLVESLIKEDNKKYRVLGIVGMGGIGKTTLASHIFNDEKIEENFSKRVWVCISQDFSETKLLEAIIKGMGGNSGAAETMAELVSRLSSLLSKRYFIVLDDVWKADVWEDLLRYPFENARANGRIVITTRDESVARSIRAEIHHVDKMDDDSCWKLLYKNVFEDDDEEEEISSFKKIGMKIVEKCDGLPLAVKVIAGVLRSMDRNTVEWNKVLESDAWSMCQLHEKLPRALFLSYENLPSDLKQCFLYCSLFPEDYKMHRKDLIHYWVAEGFVKATQGDALMEDLAEDHYRELIWRNLLHGHNGHNDDDWCTMHDLLRSLALFLIRDESIFLGDEQTPNTNPLSKLRRLSMVNAGEMVEVPDVIKQQKCLRSLLVWRSYKTMVPNELFENLRYLRVVKLTNTRLDSLPDSVGDLLHLRYLNLYRAEIKELPESIGRLLNLEILNLSYCESLHTLPKAITKLYNLRCLRLQRTPLTHVPNGIGKLQHLNHLEGFVVGHDDRTDAQDDEGCGLEELQSLSQLRYLSIQSLERAQPGGDLVLGNSRSLRTLILNGKRPPRNLEEAIAIQRNDEIYNELSPQSTHLQKLEIHNFVGTGFFSWMMSSPLSASFPNLASITLDNCISFPQLPPLGLLPQLKFLYVKQAYGIKTIGPEFLGPHASSAATSFPKLEKLTFQWMFNWEEWSFGMVEGVGEERRVAPKLLPRLTTLTLDSCPKLRVIPPLGLLPQLKSLKIVGADAIKTIGPEFLGPRSSSAAASFPKLEGLCCHVDNWEVLFFGMVEGVGEEKRVAPNLPPHLMNLSLLASPKLRALPEGLRLATNLQRLVINHAHNLKEINNLPSLKSLTIFDCPRLEHVENLDKLQFLMIQFSRSTNTSTTDTDGPTERLPQGLLALLQNAPAATQNLKEFKLICGLPLLKTFLKDGPNWSIIQPIPRVEIGEYWRPSRRSSYIRYTRDPPTFETHIEKESEESKKC
ncbi:putative disease resistance protein RGA3 [Elaeis guineensis]|uniref:Disease resistance protein RGA3 n=1 Tax=Elaeis guineensis var. tenera TaxID=51953 RepID=A0A6I9S154_ELAGV|nr:putative disease resistance protein RGA3 [Elaeis guineensis]